ncbi:MAG TPA: rhomboid family intramembrane serine protease [Vulgatibacter sp.]|nr:rhomboid family intramembrane serine protease [Vulgatibacter sp.]
MQSTRIGKAFATFPVTCGLLALIGAVFVVEVLAGGSEDAQVLARLGANYAPLVIGHGQWWRLVTSTLMHIGLLHLLVNGWALWQLGRLSEITFGRATTLALFVFTGVAGSFVTLATVKLSAGASGALFGIEGALVAFFLRHRDRLTPAGANLLKQLLGWSMAMIVFSFLVPGIDVLGHLGGFGAGLAAGWRIRPRVSAESGQLARGAAAAAAFAIVVSIAFAMLTDLPI